MINLLRVAFEFSKKSRPAPKLNKLKETRFGFAQSDEKAAKLAKKELEAQIKKRQEQELNKIRLTQQCKKLHIAHHPSLQLKMLPEERYKLETKRAIDLGIKLPKPFEPLPEPHQFKGFSLYDQPPIPIGNYVSQVDKHFHIQKVQKVKEGSRRCGLLGVKLGMTSLWDKWGKLHAVTAIRVDRCQVVQQKTNEKEEYNAVQVGVGQKLIHKIKRTQMGHYMRANVPPKRALFQFKVDPQNFLPVGYMFSARHFTPGQLVDCISRTVGKGMTGTIKNFGFRRQPATHGNSRSHRVPGSTGCRQDPGRVFKNKKMYGRAGFQQRITQCLKVFKIDVQKNIIYIKGCISGKAGTVVRIRDAYKMWAWNYNKPYLNFPTFIELPGEKYASQFQMYQGISDPSLVQLHDNAYIVEDDGEDAGAALNKQDDDDDD